MDFHSVLFAIVCSLRQLFEKPPKGHVKTLIICSWIIVANSANVHSQEQSKNLYICLESIPFHGPGQFSIPMALVFFGDADAHHSRSM